MNLSVLDFIEQRFIEIDKKVFSKKNHEDINSVTIKDYEDAQRLAYLQGFRDGIAFMTF